MKIAIIEESAIVAQDMMETLSALAQSVVCLSFDTIQAARAGYEVAGESPNLVVVAADRDGVVQGDSDDLIWLQRQKVIAVDSRLQKGSSWRFLSKPFAEDQLVSAAEALLFWEDEAAE